MEYNISLNEQWKPFLSDGIHKVWLKLSSANTNRGFIDDVAPIPAAERVTATKRCAHLKDMLGYIAGYAHVLTYDIIVKTSTSLTSVWQQLREYYSFNSTGAQFLDLATIKLETGEKHQKLYQRLTTFFSDSLLTASCGITHHGDAVTSDEEMSPTLDNVIVFQWLHLIHPSLPGLVKQKYAPELRNKTLASLKSEISQALPSLMDELRCIEDTQVQRAGTFNPRRRSNTAPRKSFKSCTLCKAAGRSSASNHNMSECKFLPENDRRAISRSRTMTSYDDPDDLDDQSADCADFDEDEDSALLDVPSVRRVGIAQSPTLKVYYGATPIALTIDTGATSTMIRTSFAKKIGFPIAPASQRARQADGKSTLTVVGEVHCNVTRGSHTFKFDGLVANELENDILAGTPFLLDNDIGVRPAKNQIVVKGRDIIYYGPQHRPNVATARRIQPYLCRGSDRKVVLPGDFIEFQTPGRPDTTWALEPRLDFPVNKGCDPDRAWPHPQEIQSIDNTIRIVNTRTDPIVLQRHEHVCQVRPIEVVELNTSHESVLSPIDTKSDAHQPFSSAVSLDPQNCLTPELQDKFKSVMLQHDDVFNPAISTYNGASGDIKATVNMGPTLPPQRKGRLPQYNKSTLDELQDKFDELERAGVLAKPEKVNVTVEYLNISFLVKKSSGGTRLVTSFGDVGRYSKPQPSVMPSVDKVLRDIASWNYIIVTDLLQSFYQIPLDQQSMKFCGVASPFKGVRVYQRAAMGMPGSETCLEELMSRVLGDLIQEGRVAKLADDLYCGGETPQEAFCNWSLVLKALDDNNLRLSARKTIVCPKSTVILGWIWSAGTLKASPHRVTALASVEPPKTVLALRSFVGAYKVLSRVLPGYAQYLQKFDQLTAGKKSQERIVWDDDLLSKFKDAQQALNNSKVITLPRPGDTLWIVTDGAVKSRGMGATMYILRDKLYLAGFFNATLHKYQVTWLPCEVEAVCIASAIKHFAPYIVQSSITTQVLTDSRPCVQAYEKLNRGEFSNSARITTFLSAVSRYQIRVSHISGAANLPSDYTSRNATDCSDPTCQLCKFISKIEDSVVMSIDVKDVIDGITKMPFISRVAWYQTQLECPDVRRAHAFLKQGTRPTKKATDIKDTKRYLHVVTLANDGLVVFREELPFHLSRDRIVVPRAVLDGFLTALHVRFDHPSQNQLKKVFNRYFYALDIDKSVGLISANCHHCLSLRSFPTTMTPQTSEPPPDTIGVSFAADVIRRYRQYILVLRETVTSYTRSMLISNEQHSTLRDALVILCAEFKASRDQGAYVRVDAAPAFPHLSRDAQLARHGIRLIIGHVKNTNKNPVAERAIEELGLECLKISPEGGPLSDVTLALATSRLNSRIRSIGLSAFELWTQRDQITGSQLPVNDKECIQRQHTVRQKNHPTSAKSKARGKPVSTPRLSVGDLVFLKGDRNKCKSRDKYLVVDIIKSMCKVRKFTQSQFRSKVYDVKLCECIPLTPTVLRKPDRDNIRGLEQSSDSGSESEAPEYEVTPSQDDLANERAEATHHDEPPADIVPPPAIVDPPPVEDQPQPPPTRRWTRPSRPPPWLNDIQWDF